jgi:hypothetical protein
MTAIGKLPLTDKMLHCTAYLALSFLASLAYPQTRTSIVIVIALALMGAILELFQALVPGRTRDVTDECANILGLVSGMIIGLLGGYKLTARSNYTRLGSVLWTPLSSGIEDPLWGIEDPLWPSRSVRRLSSAASLLTSNGKSRSAAFAPFSGFDSSITASTAERVKEDKLRKPLATEAASASAYSAAETRQLKILHLGSTVAMR